MTSSAFCKAAGVYLLMCRQSKFNISDYTDLDSLGKLCLMQAMVASKRLESRSLIVLVWSVRQLYALEVLFGCASHVF